MATATSTRGDKRSVEATSPAAQTNGSLRSWSPWLKTSCGPDL